MKGIVCIAVLLAGLTSLAYAQTIPPAITEADSVDAKINLAMSYRKSGQTRQAVAVMQQARLQEPGNPFVLSQLAYALIADKQQEEAVNTFDVLIAMQPDNVMAYNGKAVAFDSAGNHVAAQEIYQKALSLAPHASAVQNNLALSMIMSDQLAPAIRILESVLAQTGDTAIIRQNLALAYGLKGDEAKARALNLKDVTPEQAEENLRFYKRYALLKQKYKNMTIDQVDAFESSAQPVAIIGAKEDLFQNDPVESSPSAGSQISK